MKNRQLSISIFLFFLFFSACSQQVAAPSSTLPPPTSTPTFTLAIPTFTPTPTITPTPVPTTATPQVIEFLLDEFPVEQLSIGDEYSPELGNLGYDVQQYHLEINVDPAFPEQFNNTTFITAISLIDNLEYVSLDFTGFKVHNVEVNDDDAQFLRTQFKLLIKLNESFQKGEEFNVYIHYSGAPDDSDTPYSFIKFSQGPIFPTNDTMIVISEPDGARRLFPCNDHPRDKASFSVDIITPQGLFGVSNGNLIDAQILDSGKNIFSWISNDEMAPYLLTVAIGDFQIKEYTFDNGLVVRNYLLPGTESAIEKLMPVLNEAMTYFESLFGPYPLETYGHVLHKMDGITLESQATVALSSDMIDENTMVHELLHMWFGNWVGLDSWGEIWRNEGFATYFAKSWLYRDTTYDYDKNQDAQYLRIIGSTDLDSLGSLPKNDMFGFESYVVGSVVVHKLRQEVGDEAFFAGLQQYFHFYGGSTASDKEFQSIMENACLCSLEEFFAFWLDSNYKIH